MHTSLIPVDESRRRLAQARMALSQPSNHGVLLLQVSKALSNVQFPWSDTPFVSSKEDSASRQTIDTRRLALKMWNIALTYLLPNGTFDWESLVTSQSPALTQQTLSQPATTNAEATTNSPTPEVKDEPTTFTTPIDVTEEDENNEETPSEDATTVEIPAEVPAEDALPELIPSWLGTLAVDDSISGETATASALQAVSLNLVQDPSLKGSASSRSYTVQRAERLLRITLLDMLFNEKYGLSPAVSRVVEHDFPGGLLDLEPDAALTSFHLMELLFANLSRPEVIINGLEFIVDMSAHRLWTSEFDIDLIELAKLHEILEHSLRRASPLRYQTRSARRTWLNIAVERSTEHWAYRLEGDSFRQQRALQARGQYHALVQSTTDNFNATGKEVLLELTKLAREHNEPLRIVRGRNARRNTQSSSPQRGYALPANGTGAPRDSHLVHAGQLTAAGLAAAVANVNSQSTGRNFRPCQFCIRRGIDNPRHSEDECRTKAKANGSPARGSNTQRGPNSNAPRQRRPAA